MKSKKLVIFGTGEIGELAKFYFNEDSDYDVVAFCADDAFIKESTFSGLPLVKLSELEDKYPSSKYYVHVALSYKKLNKIREKKYLDIKNRGYILPSYICSKSVYWNDLNVGDNCFILENQTIQPTVKIGSNVMIWSGNHLGHGSEIHDHTYISSHVVISGHCVVGERTFLGVNATVKDFTKIGKDVFIAMDASVVGNVEDGAMVLGAKSESYKEDNKITKMIKRKYFN